MTKVCILSSVHHALDNRIFYREACSLRSAGYEVEVVAVHNSDATRAGIRIVGLAKVPASRRPLLWFDLFRRALASHADIFHFHDPELLAIVPWIRLFTGKPTIYDVHEANAEFVELKTGIPTWLRPPAAQAVRWLEPLLARMHSGLVFADEQIARSFEHVVRPKTVLLNYPSQELVEQGIAASKLRYPREAVVLHLGGHKSGRGTLLMLEAFVQVLQAVPTAQLRLVGPFFPASFQQQVQQRIGDLGIAHAVTLSGPITFDTVEHHLSQAAVGWIPLEPIAKFQKNIPTKLFEYMAFAVPVVSSDLLPVRPYVQSGENGFLVTPDSPAAHAQAIIKLLTQPELAASLGQRGQELVLSRCNWGIMEPRLLKLYSDLLS
jgi:glycosyltransferase involved in cell wall biosynthesis